MYFPFESMSKMMSSLMVELISGVLTAGLVSSIKFIDMLSSKLLLVLVLATCGISGVVVFLDCVIS